MFRYSFLLAVLLASAGLQGAEKAPQSHPPSLSDHTAAKLLIHIAKPVYPAIAKVNLIQGTVKLRIVVNRKGRVIAAHVIKGHALLAAAALKAVHKWVYRPYHSSGGATPFSTYVGISFELNPRKFQRRAPSNPYAFLERQIHPPEVISQPRLERPAARARFRVLLDSDGKVLDATPLETTGPDAELALKSLQHWKFRPARWGALAVPWYIIVEIPYESALAAQAGQSARQ